MSSNERAIVACLVREHKAILLSSFSPSITAKMKQELWEEIRQQAVEAGAVKLANKDWKYVRESIWSATRRDALAKKAKSDAGMGRVEIVFTEVDNLVFDILGINSADPLPITSERKRRASSKLLQWDDVDVAAGTTESVLGNGQESAMNQESVMNQEFGNFDLGNGHESAMMNQGLGNLDLDYEYKRARLQLTQLQIEGQKLANQKTRLEMKLFEKQF